MKSLMYKFIQPILQTKITKFLINSPYVSLKEIQNVRILNKFKNIIHNSINGWFSFYYMLLRTKFEYSECFNKFFTIYEWQLRNFVPNFFKFLAPSIGFESKNYSLSKFWNQTPDVFVSLTKKQAQFFDITWIKSTV